MGRDRISLNGRRRLRPCRRPHPFVIPPRSLLQSGIASESPERERERVLALPTPSTAIPKLWPPYSDKSGGRRGKPEGRKEGDGRDPEAGGKRHKNPEPAELSDQAGRRPFLPPSWRPRLRLFEGMDPIILDARAQHDTAAFPLLALLVPISPNPYQPTKSPS